MAKPTILSMFMQGTLYLPISCIHQDLLLIMVPMGELVVKTYELFSAFLVNLLMYKVLMIIRSLMFPWLQQVVL